MNPKVIQARALFLEGLLTLMTKQTEIIVAVLQTATPSVEAQKALYLEASRMRAVLMATISDVDVDPDAGDPVMTLPQAVALRERTGTSLQALGEINQIANRLDAGGAGHDVKDTAAQKTALRNRLIVLRDAIVADVSVEL